mgnify:CR=1 FL=1
MENPNTKTITVKNKFLTSKSKKEKNKEKKNKNEINICMKEVQFSRKLVGFFISLLFLKS